MDASTLLPPTGTPLTGIEFDRRLPCGEVERAKRVSPFIYFFLYVFTTYVYTIICSS